MRDGPLHACLLCELAQNYNAALWFRYSASRKCSPSPYPTDALTMLILPLHKPLNLQTLPWVTVLLVLVNFWVYFALQVPAERRLQIAGEYYLSSELWKVEVPAFRKLQHDPQTSEMLRQLEAQPLSAQAQALLVPMQFHPEFRRALDNASVAPTDPASLEKYQRERNAFDTLWDAGNFTYAHAQQSGQFDLRDAFTAMFLHADAEHLIGNMVMLLMVGLLVEGALGGKLYLAVYLLAGIGGGIFSAVLRANESGFGLGASGAIAGLMGALPVLWGLRQVRVFYWVLFFFDYTRVPALSLLPIWLGKEFYYLLTSDENIGFDAHAGGMVTGALLCWLVRHLRWERQDFFADSQPISAGGAAAKIPDLSYAQGLQALGALEFSKAHVLLERAARMHPADFQVSLAAYRAARFGPGGVYAQAAARRALAFADAELSTEQVSELHALWLDSEKAGVRPQLRPSEQLNLAKRWLDGGFIHSAAPLLVGLARSPELDARPALARLADALDMHGDPRGAQLKGWLAKQARA